jgi:hypothetical protein
VLWWVERHKPKTELAPAEREQESFGDVR